MLYGHLQHTKGLPVSFNGLFPVVRAIIGRILFCQLFDSGQLFNVAFQDPYGAEKDDAAEISGVLLRYDLILIDHAEGRLGATPDGIQLVSLLGTVKVELSVVIDIAHRNGVGIPLVTHEGQYPGGPPVQDGSTHFLRQNLFFAAHFPKHLNTLPFKNKNARLHSFYGLTEWKQDVYPAANHDVYDNIAYHGMFVKSSAAMGNYPEKLRLTCKTAA